MKTVHLKNPNLFEILDEQNGRVYYGFDQEWYASEWQRRSGCGPTVVSTIFYYIGRSRAIPGICSALSRGQSPAFLEKTWRHVTPTIHGIPSADLLCKGIRSYSEAEHLGIETERLDIPASRRKRPAFPRLLSFLSSSLSEDLPAAFLNLHNGEERQLDSWHWVTAVSMDYEENGGAAFLEILDEGAKKRIDLRQWFQTTMLGGGFVRFRLPAQARYYDTRCGAV